MMQISKLQLKFRNQLRNKEVDAYKQRVREYFLDQGRGGVTNNSMGMDCQMAYYQHDCIYSQEELGKLQEIIIDFQCNYSNDVRTHQNYWMDLTSLPCNYFDYRIDDLEMVLAVCFKASFQGNYQFLQRSNCLEIITNVFYLIMEKSFTKLLNHTMESSLYQRLKNIWNICHQHLLGRFIDDYSEGNCGQQKEKFIVRLVAEKAMYFHRLKLLRNRMVLQRNKFYFGLIFDSNLGVIQGVDYDRIIAAFILCKNYEATMQILPVEMQILREFLEENICGIVNELDVNRVRGQICSKQLIQAYVMILQMIIHLSCVKGNAINEDILHRGLKMGLEILDQCHSSQLRESLVIDLIKVALKQKLYESNNFNGIVTQICSQTIFANIPNKLFEILAIQILAIMEDIHTLTNIQIHYGLCMIQHEGEKDFYQLCLQLIQYIFQNNGGNKKNCFI